MVTPRDTDTSNSRIKKMPKNALKNLFTKLRIPKKFMWKNSSQELTESFPKRKIWLSKDFPMIDKPMTSTTKLEKSLAMWEKLKALSLNSMLI
jgi:hypothetical protein